jgi:hypothetical protein
MCEIIEKNKDTIKPSLKLPLDIIRDYVNQQLANRKKVYFLVRNAKLTIIDPHINTIIRLYKDNYLKIPYLSEQSKCDGLWNVMSHIIKCDENMIYWAADKTEDNYDLFLRKIFLLLNDTSYNPIIYAIMKLTYEINNDIPLIIIGHVGELPQIDVELLIWLMN